MSIERNDELAAVQLAEDEPVCGRFFGTTPEFWMGLQAQFDLAVQRGQLGDRLEREVRPLEAAG
jgi:hypothetical protein